MSVLPSIPLLKLAEEATRQFAERFGRVPSLVAAAPGRVNLIGGHVDYNDGIVLPLAIDRYTVVAGDSNDSSTATLYSNDRHDECLTIQLDRPMAPQSDGWGNYARGVIAGFQQAGLVVPGHDAVIVSSVPIGGGLSSSASLEVALATLLEGLSKQMLDPKQKALLCQQAEHEFAGVPCGVMDQITAVFGQADQLVKIDCRSLDVELVPWDSQEVAILILNTHTAHQLPDGQYGLRRQQCTTALKKLGHDSWRDVTAGELDAKAGMLDEQELRRARHVVTEIQRSQLAVEAIKDRDWPLVGQQLFDSHESLRENFQVSCPELDLLVDEARRMGIPGGVYGMRMTGAGFGGCTVALVNPQRLDDVIDPLQTEFRHRFGRLPTAMVSRPSRGTHLIVSP